MPQAVSVACRAPSRCSRPSRRLSDAASLREEEPAAPAGGRAARRDRHRREPGDEDRLHRRRDVGAAAGGAGGVARRRRPRAVGGDRVRARARAAARSSGWRGRRSRGSGAAAAARARSASSQQLGRGRCGEADRLRAGGRGRARPPAARSCWRRGRGRRRRPQSSETTGPEQRRQVDQVPVGADPEVGARGSAGSAAGRRRGRRWRWSPSRPGRRGRRARPRRTSPLGIGRCGGGLDRPGRPPSASITSIRNCTLTRSGVGGEGRGDRAPPPPGRAVSSASRKITTSPAAALEAGVERRGLAAVLLQDHARPGPRTRPSSSREPSVEPSSTTITRDLPWVCAQALSIASAEEAAVVVVVDHDVDREVGAGAHPDASGGGIQVETWRKGWSGSGLSSLKRVAVTGTGRPAPRRRAVRRRQFQHLPLARARARSCARRVGFAVAELDHAGGRRSRRARRCRPRPARRAFARRQRLDPELGVADRVGWRRAA